MGWKSCHAEREQTRTDIKLTHHLFYLVFSCLLGRAWVFFFSTFYYTHYLSMAF